MTSVTKLSSQYIEDIFHDKKELLKRTVCKGATDLEFELFVHVCKRTGLDPFSRQIYSVPRYDAKEGKWTRTIQTGIDGLRLIADRTGNYAPGKEISYSYDKEGKLISACAIVKKKSSDGMWHEISSTAFYQEFVQLGKDKLPTKFWIQMPHVMLGKAAEAQALRRAFPMEMSGVYIHEEMVNNISSSKEDEDLIEIKTEEEPEVDFIIPEDISQEKINEYFEILSSQYKMSIRDIKKKALSNLEGFWENFKKWNAIPA